MLNEKILKIFLSVHCILKSRNYVRDSQYAALKKEKKKEKKNERMKEIKKEIKKERKKEFAFILCILRGSVRLSAGGISESKSFG